MRTAKKYYDQAFKDQAVAMLDRSNQTCGKISDDPDRNLRRPNREIGKRNREGERGGAMFRIGSKASLRA